MVSSITIHHVEIANVIICTNNAQYLFSLLQKKQDQIDLQLKVAELNKSNEMLEDHITFLNDKMHEKTEETKRLHQDYQGLQEEVAKQTRYYEGTITDLRAMLQTIKAQVVSLNQYKKIYEDLQDGFQYPIEIKKKTAFATIFRKSPGNRKTVQATRKAHLLSCIEATKQLQHQLMQVQNSVFEDFDLYLENHRNWLASREFQNIRDDPAYCIEELEIQAINKEFAGKQKLFQQSMAQIVTELALVNQHKESLQQQLDEQEKYLFQIPFESQVY
ncbi:hypothetical protein chiPu_0000598 [Chiloscyllium punctatum]|uniref:Uncharacterized protein n=1 Tax=Chiloscyllium punctatum TaxID=137246 RepID=A0A401RVR9_CHIPU|nr:hypothetical protein [Chiloscyllium punctatum]